MFTRYCSLCCGSGPNFTGSGSVYLVLKKLDPYPAKKGLLIKKLHHFLKLFKHLVKFKKKDNLSETVFRQYYIIKKIELHGYKYDNIEFFLILRFRIRIRIWLTQIKPYLIGSGSEFRTTKLNFNYCILCRMIEQVGNLVGGLTGGGGGAAPNDTIYLCNFRNRSSAL